MAKKRKNLDIEDVAIKTLTKKAVDEGTVFKLLAESILENAAKKHELKKMAQDH